MHQNSSQLAKDVPSQPKYDTGLQPGGGELRCDIARVFRQPQEVHPEKVRELDRKEICSKETGESSQEKYFGCPEKVKNGFDRFAFRNVREDIQDARFFQARTHP